MAFFKSREFYISDIHGLAALAPPEISIRRAERRDTQISNFFGWI
jgi:hypothetical protein